MMEYGAEKTTEAHAPSAGLATADAMSRLQQHGPNVLPAPPRPHAWRLLLAQFTHFFACLLWIAVVLAYFAGMPQLSVAIALVIVINGAFAFAQEYRADRAAERLRELMPTSVTVRRDGHRMTISAAELVIGDWVLLEAGNQISADLRIHSAQSLAIDESMLTGESVPRRIDATEPDQSTLYAGTFVVEGAGEAEVIAVGTATRLAEITALTRQTRRPPSPLALRLHRLVLTIAVVSVLVGAAAFGLALLLGMRLVDGFVLALGVTVALVPEGLLPTVTLSLAWGARRMADRRALVRRLESVETLGSVTFICTDKTGTLTRNEMSVVDVWTPKGKAHVAGVGYEPHGEIQCEPATAQAIEEMAYAAVRASTGQLRRREQRWEPHGDPMEVALWVLALRVGLDLDECRKAEPTETRFPFDRRRLRSSAIAGGKLFVKGAPESILACCAPGEPVRKATEAATAMTNRGLRTLAIAVRTAPSAAGAAPSEIERDLHLLGVVGLLDPPRDDVADVIAACRTAGIKLAMVTGDHRGTARAVASQVGLLGSDALVVEGNELPQDDTALGELLERDGVVVARVRPEDKLRITRVLQARGHVVAMTGDGVNDAPALRDADIGIAMGATGTDVAREAADLVLLDDHFATIVAAIALGRATFFNIRRFLTYHLTDNVAELAPFVLWALSAGHFPLAIGVLQILALDIGTDLLPALALGAEPPAQGILSRRAPTGQLLDRAVMKRAFGILGPAEVVASMFAFATVLVVGGWHWGTTVEPGLLSTASGTAFAAIVLGQLANAFACRSEHTAPWHLRRARNVLLMVAVAIEIGVLLVFLGVPFLASALGGTWPSLLGWMLASLAIPLVLCVDALWKSRRRQRARLPL